MSSRIDPRLLIQLLLLEEEQADQEVITFCVVNEDASEVFKQRRQEGAYELLIQRHLVDNDTKFYEYFRLSPAMFEEVLSFVGSDLSRERQDISPREKLCITLR